MSTVMSTSASMRGPWPGMDAGYVKIRKSEFGINAMKKLLTLAGCFAAIGALPVRKPGFPPVRLSPVLPPARNGGGRTMSRFRKK